MFLHLSVILSTGGRGMSGRHPQADTPEADTPPRQTPLLGSHPSPKIDTYQADTPWLDTPQADTTPPPRQTHIPPETATAAGGTHSTGMYAYL